MNVVLADLCVSLHIVELSNTAAVSVQGVCSPLSQWLSQWAVKLTLYPSVTIKNPLRIYMGNLLCTCYSASSTMGTYMYGHYRV